MGLTATLQKAAQTVFTSFGDIVLTGTLIQVIDDGFTKDEPEFSVSVIPVSNLEEEQNTIKFNQIVQPNDSVVLLLGIELSIPIKNGYKLKFMPKEETAEQTFMIVDKIVDPAKALYILLVRKL